MGIYALIIPLRLVCVAAGSRLPMRAAHTAALLASRAVFFYGSKSLSWARASYSVLGDNDGDGSVSEKRLPIIRKNATWC